MVNWLGREVGPSPIWLAAALQGCKLAYEY